MNLKETWLRLLETIKTDLNSTILLDLKKKIMNKQPFLSFKKPSFQ